MSLQYCDLGYIDLNNFYYNMVETQFDTLYLKY